MEKFVKLQNGGYAGVMELGKGMGTWRYPRFNVACATNEGAACPLPAT